MSPHFLTWHPTKDGSLKRSVSRLTIFASVTIVSLLMAKAFVFMPSAKAATTTQNSIAVVSVSAASYVGGPAPIAPNSIVAAFGTQLARATEGATTQPLPMNLSGTTVKVTDSASVERLAPLFFVSANQINYLVPAGTANGDADVTITSILANSDQVISRGRLRVAATGPSLFAANSSGSGAPAAATGRVTANGSFVFDPNPPFEADPLTPGQLQPRPIDVGTDALPAFLILYGTGLRSAPAGAVKVLIGGVEATPDFVGASPGFSGLDQINVRIPTTLRGRGRVDFSVVANGVSSNSLTIHAAGAASGNLAISGFSISDGAIAGQTLTINGSGFASTASQNVVRFGNAQGRVISASSTQMSVIVPLGAESGRVTLQTPQGEIRSTSAFRVRTSISGIVQTTGANGSTPVAMENVTVRLAGENISVRTNRQGSFIVPNLAPGPKLVEIDAETTNSTPPFPRVTLKLNVQADRDNQFSQPISMQQIIGQGVSVGSTAGTIAELPRSKTGPGKNPLYINVTDRNVTLDIPTGTMVKFPDGKSTGRVNLTALEKSRLPGIRLPPGVYSSTIVQITPIGTTFNPGASLSFPNPDPANLNAGAKVDFYRYDQAAGVFIKKGTGTISNDKARVASDGRIVDQGSYWFAAAQSGVTTVTGRVIDVIGFPVPGAQVTVNGRADVTDQNGGFIISDVATAGTPQLQVEAVLPQQFGIVPRGTSPVTNVIVGGTTNVGTIALSNTSDAGLVLSPFAFRLSASAPTLPVTVTLTQPAPGGGLVVSLLSADTAVTTVPTGVTIPAGQTTTSFTVSRTGPGFSAIIASATLNGTRLDSFAILESGKPAPTLTSLNPSSVPIFGRLTISGTGFSTDPGNNLVGILRSGQLVGLFDPGNNELVQDQAGRPALRVKVPPINDGAAQLIVAVVDDLTGVLSDISAPLSFNVLTNTVAAPVLSSLSPASGKPKDQITLNGSGFSTSPGENFVSFRQNGVNSDALVIQASASQLLITVPSIFIDKGAAVVFAQRVNSDGSASNLSNALDFNVTQGPVTPSTPTIASFINPQTQNASGRDGDVLNVQGTNFGKNFFNIQTGNLANSEPFISVLLFYQNSQLTTIALPTGATGGTQLTSKVPTGLSAGPAQITIVTFDLEAGLISNESAPVNFTITVGSIRVVTEDEPNDSPAAATIVPFPSLVLGDVDVTDPSGFTVTLGNGTTTEKVHDLFEFSVTQTTNVQITLSFDVGDLDLFLIKAQPNANGTYTILSSSVSRSNVAESIQASLPAGDYLIGVAGIGSLSNYLLDIEPQRPLGPESASPNLSNGVEAMKGEVVPVPRNIQVRPRRRNRMLR